MTSMRLHRFRPWAAPAPLLLLAVLLLAVASSLPLVARASKANDEACAFLADSIGSPSLTPLSLAAVPPNYCASVLWSPPGNAGTRKLRGVLLVSGGRGGALVVDATAGAILWLNDTNGNGVVDDEASPAELTTVLTQTGLNHGLLLNAAQDRLMASSATTVYSWPFDAADPSAPITAAGEVLVKGIPTGGHTTRTILLDPANENMLYVSVGSNDNVDPPSQTDRALVARFDLTTVPSGGHDYSAREVVAAGVRNEVGLRWDRHGVLWGVENGADNLQRSDLGANINNENPGEEVHKFGAVGSNAASVGKSYGYPFCWSEYNLPDTGRGRGAQWAWPSFMDDGTHDDAWCSDTANVAVPHAVMEAHTAPLDLAFYPNEELYGSPAAPFAFPPHAGSGEAAGGDYMFVSQHGSWNRQPPAGYRVVRFPLQDTAGSVSITGAAEPFLYYDSSDGSHTSPQWNLRAVGLAVGERGEMFLTDDASGSPKVILIRYVAGYTPSDFVSSTGDASTGGGGDAASSTGDLSSAPAAAVAGGMLLSLLAGCAAVALLAPRW